MAKTQKNNKKLQISEKSKKILIACLLAAVGIMVLAGMVFAFLLNYDAFSPNPVDIFDDGMTVYLSADANENYRGYRFRFMSSSDEIIVDSENNIITIDELEKQGVELGKNYNVSVCYLGQTSGSNSAYSDTVAFTAYKYLAAPTLEYNAQSKSLQWNIVDHADKYQVYFSPTAQPITITENNLDLSTFAGGEYNFSVVALSDSAFYRQSPSSNAIIVPVIYSIKPFESASFDKEQMILTLQGSERLSKIKVQIGDFSFDCSTFDMAFDQAQNKYTYKIDLSAYYDDQTIIGACPIATENYTSFDGEFTYAQI